MPFLLAEILNFQGSTHRTGVGSFSELKKNLEGISQKVLTDSLRSMEEWGISYKNNQ